MADTDRDTHDRLAGLVDHLAPQTESRLRTLPRRSSGPSRQRILAVLVAFAVAVAAIGLTAYAFLHGSKPTRPASPRGGSIVVGSDWPECLNPINGCASATGAWWTVLQHVLPHAMVLDEDGNWVASPLLVEAPSLANGGLTEEPFTVTYHLNPKAIWADGTPITSSDFEFTWRALMNTEAAYNTAGYDLIESIDATDPKTALIRFKDVYVDWPDLFGGPQGGLLEKAAFPQFADDPNPNLTDEMQQSIPFSGGPWILKSWTTAQAVLIPNDRYYGRRALLDQVIFVPLFQGDVLQPLIAGDVALIHVSPSDTEVVTLESHGNVRNVQAVGGDGFYLEALWFNHQRSPLDDRQVREALMYAIDRQSLIDAFVKANNPNAEVLNCGFIALPNVGPWCERRPFDRFVYDPVKARSILKEAGYECSSTPCTKNGEKLVIEYSRPAGPSRRQLTFELLKDKAREAGFELRAKNYEGGIMLGDLGPKGAFGILDYSSSGSLPDPSVTTSLACENIPSKANRFSGDNWIRWCNREATSLMHRADHELDPQKRLDLMNRIYQLEADDFISLPLYVVPQATLWRTDQVAGPVAAFGSSPNGPYWNVNEWHLPAREALGR
jgi:peptide/nickel transport system substrate-binding protein